MRDRVSRRGLSSPDKLDYWTQMGRDSPSTPPCVNWTCAPSMLIAAVVGAGVAVLVGVAPGAANLSVARNRLNVPPLSVVSNFIKTRCLPSGDQTGLQYMP